MKSPESFLQLLFLVLPAAVFMSCARPPTGSGPIPSTGGAMLTITNVSLFPIHLQKDARWADHTIGGSDEPIAAVGCTLCGVSMALAHHGIALPPDRLNARLKRCGGYNERGWLEWTAIPSVTEGRATAVVHAEPSHEVIDSALRRGGCVIAKIMLRDRVQHWVLIVGKRGNEYLVKDPLGTGKELDMLSELAREIHAIRVVKPAPGGGCIPRARS